jgi:diguanylate cyclase (GGDEF)-like protein
MNKLEKLAFTDNLTGAFNRHYFTEHASKAFMKDEGGRERACIIMFDIDHFKRVNDTHGHSAGDAILQGVAQKVQGVLRSNDLFARYGGEEFIIYASKASLESALKLAERIRRVVANARFTYAGTEIRVTVSLGVAERERAEGTFSRFINLADEALYAAKANGRNRVES